MRTRIKFCGFTRVADIDRAVALGVDAVGLVCVPASRRAVSVEAAVKLRHSVPAFVSCVVLVLDATTAAVQEIIDRMHPDLLQFHGRESGAFCRSFGVPYMKALAVADDLPARLHEYADASAVLLDSHTPGALGGTGQTFDWGHAQGLALRRWVLAGGLDADSVGRAIGRLRPYAVDVSSGIEAGTPGVKESGKMAAFVDAVRRADADFYAQEP
ncbi:MAG: phosphoribosylanthranilate isomerase [Nevskiaceae bacterium]|nr:MAG: phosphoribosylanthranilate isomerase [Nevskiaceae bacterium]TBR73871.1 MAG: phosphoribosylanthranilate isomerase [Nevskiaceae bacterium]